MTTSREILFIDRTVTDLQIFLAGLRPEIEPIVLDASEAAPAQMARAVRGRDGVEAIHIVAHGSAGAVNFAAGPISIETLNEHADDLGSIGETLGTGGEILLWTCRSGQGERGAAFVGALACATGAHVAAAIDLVGAAALGGRWDLEAGTRAHAVQAPLTTGGMARYAGVMAVITGTAGDDALNDTVDDDTIDALAGNDAITVSSGLDTVIGGSGSDRLILDYSGVFGTVAGGIAGGDFASGYDGSFSNFINTSVDFSGIEHFTITTGGSDDAISTGEGDDIVNTGAGNDFVNVGSGIDEANGGTGEDGIAADMSSAATDITVNLVTSTYVTPAGTLLANFEYFLNFQTGSGNDTIVTRAIDRSDFVSSGDGNDSITIMGGAIGGVDMAIAGNGSDRLIVNYAGVSGPVVGEVTGGDFASGYDGFFSNFIDTQVVFAGVEHFTITTAGGADSITTGDGDDIVNTNTGSDAVNGAGGNDSLTGGSGNDTLLGGIGNDSLTGSSGLDRFEGGAGDDTYGVDSDAEIIVENAGEGTDLVRSTASHTLAANVENLKLDGGTANINGTGNALANLISGNSGSNMLAGGLGNDTLEGGPGADTLIGGQDSDTYILNAAGDVVTEAAEVGVDTVQSTFDYALGANVENLLLMGSAVNGTGNALANVITGNTRNNVLNSGAGNDILHGADGNDSLNGGSEKDTLAGDAGNDTLIGGSGNDTLTGGAGNDSLDGGAGIDSAAGGLGDDLYSISNATDVIFENAGEGTDRVRSTSSFTLSTNVEHLTLIGSGNTNGIGNAQNNEITGNGGNNQLKGNAGNDTLNGGAGVDTLFGGAGNDLYILNDADAITELAGGGIDLVQSTISHTLAAQVENLTLLGIAASGTGNAIANLITGNAQANTLSGEAGDDTLMAGSGNDTLTGGAGNDTLDGSAGIDSASGGLGDDLYFANNSTDGIFENAGEGIDRVRATSTFTLAANVEHLTLTGSANTNGSGNELDNEIDGNSGNNLLKGNDGNDTLDGGTGTDTLNGGAGADVLVWDAADASIQGGVDEDILRLDGSGVALDLTLILDSRVIDVEIVDVTGSGNNSLTLALSDVIAISSSTDTLRVDGNTGDSVTVVGGGWTDAGVAGGYHSYTQATATLLVDIDMTITI